MQLAQIRTLFDTSPTIRLLQSAHAPFVLDFLNQTFKRSGALSLGQDDLKLQLVIYLEGLHELEPKVLTGPVDRYLTIWSDAGWLNRHLQGASSEPQYQLTRYAEEALQFVDQSISRRSGLVGTDGRLRMILETLSDLVRGASADREKRLASLREQQASIQSEIDSLTAGEQVDVYQPTQIRERFQTAVDLFKTLHSDFRAVEERFHEIAVRIQQDQQAALESRGKILSDAMDSEDLLKTEDEGISFYSFIAFLFSPDGQQTLRETIDDVVRLEPLQDQQESIQRLREMVKSLLNEADKVMKTNGRLSATLRKLLSRETVENRKQTADVLRDIKQLGRSLRAEPLDKRSSLISVQSSQGLFSPLSRILWTTPQSFDNRPSDHAIDLERAARERESLASLDLLDLERLRGNIRSRLDVHDRLTLDALIEQHPPESGVLELIGYFQIAYEDGHSIDRERYIEVIIPDGSGPTSTRVRMPTVTFREQRVLNGNIMQHSRAGRLGQTTPHRGIHDD